MLPKGVWSNFLNLGDQIGQGRLVLAAIAVASAVVLALVYRYTRFGLTTRAADENEKGAVLVGLSPQFLAGINWVISAVLAGAAGVLFVGFASLSPVNYTLFVIPALVAAVLGNLQSFGWATVAALLLGRCNQASPIWLPATSGPAGCPRAAAAAIIPVPRHHRLPVPPRRQAADAGVPRADQASLGPCPQQPVAGAGGHARPRRRRHWSR